MSEIRVEYGSNSGVRWLKPSQVKMYDAEGKEVSYPQCSECGAYKQEVIGMTHSAWICPLGCVESVSDI